MKADRFIFVGDVHGNLAALRGLLERIQRADVDQIVFLGDYVDKGRDSAGVIQYLLIESRRRPIVLLRGNHEDIFLKALDTGNLTHFLKIGGAPTIRSYLKRCVGPDVLADFRSCLPPAHIELIKRMPERYEASDVVASHVPIVDDQRFKVSAHIPVGAKPVITQDSAHIDTGCGSDENGLLTGLMWPSLTYIQVDANGTPI